MPKKDEKTDITYEQAALELESVVNMLESGDLPLEESIKVFEKGISLVRICNKKLDDIEKRITLLMEGKDGIIEKDFNPDDL
ncbi:MAG TPA: exodeoxyribonuclease VII small subunit [Clostridiaceae bacterium]|jgi:exodeoxyribonuclease VII small subunit|nr:exodeoxyribonuclease VII small subunit [Clostridiaceae bacterium]